MVVPSNEDVVCLFGTTHHFLIRPSYERGICLCGISHKKNLKIQKGQTVSAIRRRTDRTMVKRKKTKGQTTIHKTLHIKPKFEQHEPNLKLGMNSGALEGEAVHVPLMAPVVLLQLQTR